MRERISQKKTTPLMAVANAIDSAIELLAPQWGARRRKARRDSIAAQLESEVISRNSDFLQERIESSITRRQALKRRGFKTAEPNETRDSRYITEDLEINSLLDEQLRDVQIRGIGLYGDNGIARSLVESRLAYEVGAGIGIKPTVKHRDGDAFFTPERVSEINRALSEIVKSWSKHRVDKSRTMTLGMLERLFVREFANEGECFAIVGDLPYDGVGQFAGPVSTAVEVISPRRVETPPERMNDPSCRLGIQHDSRGVVVGYWIRKSHPDDNRAMDVSYSYFPKFDKAGQIRVIHIFDPLVAGQLRGLPWLLAAFNKMLDYDDYHEAEIIGKQIEACFGVVMKLDRDNKSTGAGTIYEAAVAASEERLDNGDLMERITPGFIQRIKNTESIEKVDPSRPGSSFAPFLEGSMRMIAAAANVPYETIAKNFSNVTFASGRMAMIDGNMAYTMRRSILIDLGLQPLWDRVVQTAVMQDEARGTIPVEKWLASKDAFSCCEFTVKQMPMIDPEKEIKAFALGMENELLSKDDYHDQNAEDWEAKQQQIFDEKIRCISDELKLEKFEMDMRKKLGLPEPAQDPAGDKSNSKSEDLGSELGRLWERLDSLEAAGKN